MSELCFTMQEAQELSIAPAAAAAASTVAATLPPEAMGIAAAAVSMAASAAEPIRQAAGKHVGGQQRTGTADQAAQTVTKAAHAVQTAVPASSAAATTAATMPPEAAANAAAQAPTGAELQGGLAASSRHRAGGGSAASGPSGSGNASVGSGGGHPEPQLLLQQITVDRSGLGATEPHSHGGPPPAHKQPETDLTRHLKALIQVSVA